MILILVTMMMTIRMTLVVMIFIGGRRSAVHEGAKAHDDVGG